MAIDDKYIELVNADIDGELHDRDRGELQRLLSDSDEARRLHAELSALCGKLDETEMVEPPAHLRHQLIDLIPRVPHGEPAPRSTWRDVLVMPVFRHAVAFAAGVFMTLALVNSTQISDRAFDDVTGLVGTISADAPAANADSSIILARQDLAGTVSVHRNGSLAVVEFNLSTREDVEIIAGFQDRDLWFRGFAQLENNETSVVAGDGTVKMQLSGRNRYAIYLQQASQNNAAIHLQFFASGNLVHEADLNVGDRPSEPEKSEQDQSTF